ncbi:MAG TPA: hypothetical protein PLM44_03090 [bacterium]|jgi:hypothetical protein|nr:hypothetical protein [bacterium]
MKIQKKAEKRPAASASPLAKASKQASDNQKIENIVWKEGKKYDLKTLKEIKDDTKESMSSAQNKTDTKDVGAWYIDSDRIFNARGEQVGSLRYVDEKRDVGGVLKTNVKLICKEIDGQEYCYDKNSTSEAKFNEMVTQIRGSSKTNFFALSKKMESKKFVSGSFREKKKNAF